MDDNELLKRSLKSAYESGLYEGLDRGRREQVVNVVMDTDAISNPGIVIGVYIDGHKIPYPTGKKGTAIYRWTINRVTGACTGSGASFATKRITDA